MRRAVVCALALVAMVGCDPEVGTGTYYCGPEMFCPPHLDCNPLTFSCETPDTFEPFSCPDGSERDEPDDVSADAADLGELACNYTGVAAERCIDSLADVDFVRFAIDECLTGDPHIEVEVRFPVALAVLEVDVLDEDEVVVGSGEPCAPEQNFTGMDWLCVQLPPVPGTYYVRVRATGDAACSGDCAFNQYLLYVRYPLA